MIILCSHLKLSIILGNKSFEIRLAFCCFCLLPPTVQDEINSQTFLAETRRVTEPKESTYKLQATSRTTKNTIGRKQIDRVLLETCSSNLFIFQRIPKYRQIALMATLMQGL